MRQPDPRKILGRNSAAHALRSPEWTAEFLGMPVDWVIETAQRGGLPCIPFEHAIRFDPIAIKSWVRRQSPGQGAGAESSSEPDARVDVQEVVQETVSGVFSQLRAEIRALLAPRRAGAKVLLSLREAARRLGVDRNTTLLDLIRKGGLRTVTANGKLRIPAVEVERLAIEGFDSSAPAPTRPRQAKPKVSADPGDAIRSIKL